MVSCPKDDKFIAWICCKCNTLVVLLAMASVELSYLWNQGLLCCRNTWLMSHPRLRRCHLMASQGMYPCFINGIFIVTKGMIVVHRKCSSRYVSSRWIVIHRALHSTAIHTHLKEVACFGWCPSRQLWIPGRTRELHASPPDVLASSGKSSHLLAIVNYSACLSSSVIRSDILLTVFLT